MMDFIFFNCFLEGHQLREGEHGVLAATEVVRSIFTADFRDHSLQLIHPVTGQQYYHEFVKEPLDGLFLIKVVNPQNRSCLEVLIDTRIYPNFICIEKNALNPKESMEVAMVLRYSLNLATEVYGWSATLKNNRLNEIRYVYYFWTAMDYADNLPVSYELMVLVLKKPQLVQQFLIENKFEGNISNLTING